MLMRAYLAGTSVVWGILLLILGTEPKVAEALGSYVPVSAWAWMFIAHGIITFAAVLFDSLPIRSVTALRALGCFLWTSAVTSMVLIEPIHPANAANISFALASWWLLARTGR
jgi:hypothetical protein